MEFLSVEGYKHNWTFQIVEVDKVLAAVSAFVDMGHKVIFDRDSRTGADLSFLICNASGRSTKPLE